MNPRTKTWCKVGSTRFRIDYAERQHVPFWALDVWAKFSLLTIHRQRTND